MSPDRLPQPDCPHCHGSGHVSVSTTYLDRVDEWLVPCRCVRAVDEAGDEHAEELVGAERSDGSK